MFKNLFLTAMAAATVAGSVLALTTPVSASHFRFDAAYVSALASGNPSQTVGAMPGFSRQVARPESVVVAEYPSWCYWHPYHCDESE
jgi:hypothetical protein